MGARTTAALRDTIAETGSAMPSVKKPMRCSNSAESFAGSSPVVARLSIMRRRHTPVMA
jgi:hypothetical protein